MPKRVKRRRKIVTDDGVSSDTRRVDCLHFRNAFLWSFEVFRSVIGVRSNLRHGITPALNNGNSSLDRLKTSKTPYVAIDERGLERSIHLFLFSCVH